MAPAAQPRYRIGLQFGEQRRDGQRLEKQPMHPDALAPVSQRPWLDIRPRTLPADGGTVLSRNHLPNDVSGLQSASQIPHAVQTYAIDLSSSDVWRGASFGYQPLYFEDRLLERYGSIGGVLQHCPLIHSGAHFAVATATFPLSVLHHPPHHLVRSGSPSRYELAPAAYKATQQAAQQLRNVRQKLR